MGRAGAGGMAGAATLSAVDGAASLCKTATILGKAIIEGNQAKRAEFLSVFRLMSMRGLKATKPRSGGAGASDTPNAMLARSLCSVQSETD